MPEPTLIQQQPDILRTFRQATAQRTKSEADAEARRKADRAATDMALNQARQTATAQLARTRQAQEEVQATLVQAGLQRLLEQTQPTPSVACPDANPTQELARCVSVATEVPTSIDVDIKALQQWREMTASRRSLLARLTLAVLLILG